MLSTDTIQSFILPNTPVYGAIVRLDKSLQSITEQHQYPSAINHLIAETLTSMLLITNRIKWKGRFILQFQGTGPLNMLIAKMNEKREISAMARWQDPLSVSTNDLLQQGQLQSCLIGDKQDIQRSIIPINPKGITESLEDYFTYSEQLPSKIWLCANQHAAQGFLLQAMPSDKKSFDLNTWIKQLDEQHIHFQSDNKTLLQNLFEYHDCQLFKENPIAFHCGCSRKKMEQAIISMGEFDAKEALSNQETIEIRCDFCNKTQSFSQRDVNKLFE